MLEAPLNKIRRLISTLELDVVLRHPYSVDVEGAVRRAEVVIVNGAKATIGEDNTTLLLQLLLQLVRRAVQAQQALPERDRRRVSLYVDEAHSVLTPSVATLLAEGRSAGLEACFAWQFSSQVRDEMVRSGVRSLLQSISIFRMREMKDARSLAGLAMDIYSDRISVEREDQERLRFLRRRHPSPTCAYSHQPVERQGHAAPRVHCPNAANGGPPRPPAGRAPLGRSTTARRPPFSAPSGAE